MRNDKSIGRLRSTMGRLNLPTSRRGFTVIELLVTVAVIGLLVALLLPSVNAARESARRAQCASRLRQVGLSLHGYHGLHRTFPAGSHNSWSWLTHILPQMDQQVLYEQYDFRRLPFDEPNSEYLDANLPLVLCPSDPHSERIHSSSGLGGLQFAHTNYLGSLAVGSSRGMFPYDQGIRMSKVTDGTSKTLHVGERGVVFDGVNTHGWWTWGEATSIATTQPFQPGGYDDPGAMVHWWSHHGGGGNFLLVDGAVRFLAYDIDANTFAALGTRDAGDIGRL